MRFKNLTLLLFPLSMSLSLNALAADKPVQLPLKLISPQDINGTPSLTMPYEFDSNADKLAAEQMTQDPANSTMDQITNLLKKMGATPADFKLYSTVPDSDMAYLDNQKYVCRYENRSMSGDHTIFAYDSLECMLKRPTSGSKTITTFDAKGGYNSEASDFFEDLSRAGVTSTTSNGVTTLDVSSLICSEVLTFKDYRLLKGDGGDKFHCALIDNNTKKVIPMTEQMEDRSGGDLQLEIYDELRMSLKVRQQTSASADNNVLSILVGMDSIQCQQTVDANSWKNTTCKISWSPDSVSPARQKLL